MTIIAMVWLMMMGCPKETLIKIVVVLGLIEAFATGLEDGSSIFLIIALIVGFIIYFIAKEDEEKTKHQNTSNNVTVNKVENNKDTFKSNEAVHPIDNRNELTNLLQKIKTMNENDLSYASTLFNIGLLYEKVYSDFFRSTAFVYLAMIFDKKNKQYEDEYLRLSKQLNVKKGPLWEYYITMINNVDDIEKYIEEILTQENYKKSEPAKKIMTNNQIKTPSYSKINTTYVESKFDDFNPESYLHSLGYKVGKTGLSATQRRTLLKKAIESKKISKYDVIETLERNISMFQHRSNRKQAVNDWLEDLNYVKRNF